MVAYSFQKRFAADVEAGVKRQTVRGPRKRHARPGEPIQLYTGMRTKACRKLVTPDPICLDVRPIVICDGGLGLDPVIALDSGYLTHGEALEFAMADGFGRQADALRQLRAFFFGALSPHIRKFEGVCIRWRPAA